MIAQNNDAVKYPECTGAFNMRRKLIKIEFIYVYSSFTKENT